MPIYILGGIDMVRVSNSSSINRQRIHSSFVERNRIILNRASRVDAVTPVAPVRNEISYSSANHLMASDQFYEKLEKLKREYMKFYDSERNLKHAIDAMEDNSDISFEYVKNLIDKYNTTVSSLEAFDRHIRSDNITSIKYILNEYSIPLSRVGIYIVDKLLEIDEKTFKVSLAISNDDLDILFDPIREFISRLYQQFRNIKQENPREFESGCQGLLS